MDIQRLQADAARSDIIKAQRSVLLAQMTASIIGPIIAVNYAAAVRKQEEAEGVIPGQTNGQIKIDLEQPLQLASHLAQAILQGPQKPANAVAQKADSN